MQLALNYKLLKKPKVVLVTTALTVIAYNTLFYFHPANQGWLSGNEFSWPNFLHYLILEQYLIENITIAIIFVLIRNYARWLRLYSLELNPVAISRYLMRFLPLFLVAFVFFNPLTQSARFLLNEYTNMSTDIYLYDYVLNWRLYFVYLIPVFLGGYGGLVANLVILHNKQLAQTSEDIEKLHAAQEKRYPRRLIAKDDWGEVPVNMGSVIWFAKEDRKYFAHTIKGKLRTKETLSELESSLDPSKFVRVNRATLVNIDYIQNYSFWENEKYILRLKDKDQTEFVMSRERLNKIKSQLD
ncbi:MAG: LytTR family transcriptional regulator [Roseivirga sp.]|nr:LytTR family transcriptional regulator [Roseivirga sp.]